jgi:hypothetical protein
VCVCVWKWFILPNGHSNYDDKPWDFDGTLFSDKPLAPVFYCVLSFYLGLYISLGYPRIANFRGWMIINHQNWEHPTIFRQTHIYPMKNESILTIKIRIIWAIMGNPILGIFFQYQREVHLLGVSKNEPFEHLYDWYDIDIYFLTSIRDAGSPNGLTQLFWEIWPDGFITTQHD